MSLGAIIMIIGAVVFGMVIKWFDSLPRRAVKLQLIAGIIFLLAGIIDLSTGFPRGSVPLVFGAILLVLPFIWPSQIYAEGILQLKEQLFLSGFLIFYVSYWVLLASLIATSPKLLLIGVILGVSGTKLMRIYDDIQNKRGLSNT